ncbi:MAG: hypothetical protein VX783_00765 [Chloroflexota bacterium]|nr:hypothetical protein [Chloroflexota bacterium]
MTLLILCISVYIAIILSLDFFDDEKSSSRKSEGHHDQRMMPDMMRAPVGHDQRMMPDMMRDPVPIKMTVEDYELIIQELELQKKFIERDIALEPQRIDLEIQRITNEKNKLKVLD